MIKKILSFFKKVILASLLLYAYNQFAIPLNAIIPINIVTVLFVSILGIPAMIGLVVFSFLFF